MLGAIIGDIVGSRFEWDNIKSKDFHLFFGDCHPTDDSIMTLAVAQALLDFNGDLSGVEQKVIHSMQELGRAYPDAGYGRSFKEWICSDDPQPYNSWGNGSAMRVSPCTYVANSLEEAKELSRIVSSVTHNHPEGIKGAEAVTVAIYMARNGASIDQIRDVICKDYYKIDFTLDEIRKDYTFDVSCQGSVPQALEAFFESYNFEDAIRNAVSIGGDSDTIAAIAGSIAEAYYGIPGTIMRDALFYMDVRQLDILSDFDAKYPCQSEGPVGFYQRLSNHFTAAQFEEHFTNVAAFLQDGMRDTTLCPIDTRRFINAVYQVAADCLLHPDEKYGKKHGMSLDQQFFTRMIIQRDMDCEDFTGFIGEWNDHPEQLDEESYNYLTNWFSNIAAFARVYLREKYDRRQNEWSQPLLFDRAGFMAYMEQTFNMGDFGRSLVDNLIELGVRNEIPSEGGSMADFLCEFIPELSFPEAAAFCSDKILTIDGIKAKREFWKGHKTDLNQDTKDEHEEVL